MSKAALMASEVDILKTKAANKKGAGSEEVETVWPKPEFVRLTTTLSLRPFLLAVGRSQSQSTSQSGLESSGGWSDKRVRGEGRDLVER